MKCVQQSGVGNDLSSAGGTALRGCGNFVGGYRWREQGMTLKVTLGP